MEIKLLVCLLLGLLECSIAFVPRRVCSRQVRLNPSHVQRRGMRMMAGEEGPEVQERNLDDLFREVDKANKPQTLEKLSSAVKQRISSIPKIDTSKPFRFPAYGFLAISILLGISFVGSITELATGKPLLGQAPTIAVIVGAGPGAVASFVTAVQRFEEERDEDDERLELEESRKARGRGSYEDGDDDDDE